MATTERKYLEARCTTCGRKLPNRPGGYVYSRFTGNHYCLPCCTKPRGKR